MASAHNRSEWFSDGKNAEILEVLVRRYGIDPNDESTFQRMPRSLSAEERIGLRADVIRERKRRGLPVAYEELVMQSRFVNAHREISKACDTVQLHSHSFAELLFCMSGDLEYLLGTQRYSVREGDWLIIPPGVSHRPLNTTMRPQNYYDRIVIWISGRYVSGCRKLWPDVDWTPFLPAGEGGTGAGHCLHADAQPDLQIRELFERICTEFEQSLPDWEPAVCGMTLSLMILLARVISRQHVPESSRTDLLDQIIEYVEENLNRRITLEGTARQFLISESTLSKTFRTRLNTSFYQFVKQRRLIAAKELLAQTDALSEIPEQVGFSDYSSFYRAFKKEYEMTPSQYRSLVRGE